MSWILTAHKRAEMYRVQNGLVYCSGQRAAISGRGAVRCSR